MNTITTFMSVDTARNVTDSSGYKTMLSDSMEGIRDLISVCHTDAVVNTWWHNKDGTPKELNFGERVALMHSELSEALEGFRKNKMCDKPGLEHFDMVTEEFADTIIRICDTAGAMKLALAECLHAKLLYNRKRPDHKLEAREATGGKKF
jgi:hypothetical protein